MSWGLALLPLTWLGLGTLDPRGMPEAVALYTAVGLSILPLFLPAAALVIWGLGVKKRVVGELVVIILTMIALGLRFPEAAGQGSVEVMIWELSGLDRLREGDITCIESALGREEPDLLVLFGVEDLDAFQDLRVGVGVLGGACRVSEGTAICNASGRMVHTGGDRWGRWQVLSAVARHPWEDGAVGPEDAELADRLLGLVAEGRPTLLALHMPENRNAWAHRRLRGSLDDAFEAASYELGWTQTLLGLPLQRTEYLYTDAPVSAARVERVGCAPNDPLVVSLAPE